MERNEANQYIKSMAMGIKEYGIEKALKMIQANHNSMETEEDTAIVTMALTTILAFALPSMLSDEEFMNEVIDRIAALPKEEVDMLCDAIIDGL